MDRIAFALVFSLLLAAVPGAVRSAEPVAVPMDADGVQRLHVLGGSYFFRPDRLQVKVNVPVELLVSKEPGLVPHTFVLKIPDQDIDIERDLSTEPGPVRFTIHKAGRYDFYCRNRLLFFQSHRDKGMAGVIEAVE